MHKAQYKSLYNVYTAKVLQWTVAGKKKTNWIHSFNIYFDASIDLTNLSTEVFDNT